MGSLVGDLFGGSTPSPDWGAIEKLMRLDVELNRTNREGPFSSWNWETGPDGKMSQKFSVAEGFEDAFSRLGERAGGLGMNPYESPSQFSALLDAKMGNQLQRHGIGPEGFSGDEGLGPPSASRAGRQPDMYQPPPPPQSGTAPPQGGQPPHQGFRPPPWGGGGGKPPGMGIPRDPK